MACDIVVITFKLCMSPRAFFIGGVCCLPTSFRTVLSCAVLCLLLQERGRGCLREADVQCSLVGVKTSILDWEDPCRGARGVVVRVPVLLLKRITGQ
jgi:hypothetical protein